MPGGRPVSPIGRVLFRRRGSHARPRRELGPAAGRREPLALGTATAVLDRPPGPAPEAPERAVRPRTFSRQDALVVAGSAASALALVWLLFERLLPLSGGSGFVFLWFCAFVAIYWLVVREIEGKRAATDRAISALITALAVFLLVPLVLIVVYVVAKGVKVLTPHFFTQDLRVVGPSAPGSAGGAAHAIVGTLEQIGLAILVSVPLGITTAVFLNEVGGRLKRPVRVFVDAMSGIPSIVAGLFIFAVWVVGFHRGFSGWAASLALSILMLPSVARTSEEVLRLVPDGLREASLALGGNEWRTTWNVVLPTARSGLVTAAILGVARAVGETAPLIMTSFGAKVMNANPFHGDQASLPKFVYEQMLGGTNPQIDRAWTGSLVLIALVLALFVTARVVGNRKVGGRKRRGPMIVLPETPGTAIPVD
jgi:phosphate transport system permease protein